MPIKNFVAARVKPQRPKAKHFLVADIMTQNLVLFQPGQTIHEVMRAFVKHRISGGPVVDPSGKLIGIISEADCMKQISESRYFNMPILDKSVANFMSTNVDTIDAGLSIFEAADRFSQSSRRRFPVLKDNKLVGQVSRKDIVIAALNMKSQTW
ncbi:MAG: CBS domain-containing protein [Flavobacteriaceae bacterium]